MRKFIFKISYFILIPLGISIMLDFIVSNKLKRSSDRPWENEVWNDIYKNNINADIAIYGSSTAWSHFDPKIIENSLNIPCYNFGLDGANFLWQYLRHIEYFKYNNHPKLIILSVDCNTFEKREVNPTKQFLPYMLWNFNIYKTLKLHKKMNNGVDFLIPMIRYFDINIIDNFKSLLNVNKNETYSETFNKVFKIQKSGKFRYKGYRGINLEWTSDLEKAKKKFSDYKIGIDTTLISLLENFIFEVNKKNIDLILIHSPTYIKGQNFVKNRNEIISLYEKISTKHNIPFLDYSYSSISYKKELFFNTNHLNKKGSEIFTKQLIDDLQKHKRTARYISNPSVTSHSH